MSGELNNLMNWYRFLGCLVAEDKEEFVQYYNLGNGSDKTSYGDGIWKAMYACNSQKSRAEYKHQWYLKRRKIK